MKKIQLSLVYFSINAFSTAAFAQIIPQDYTTIIKTNVLIVKGIQQWALSVETKTKKPNQTNNYTIGYNRLLENGERVGVYAAYGRRFNAPPKFNFLHFFSSPYGKIIYRDVRYDYSWFSNSNHFKSISIIAGENLGLQAQFKELCIEFSVGGGLGVVLWKKDYTINPFPIHLDAQLMLQIGHRF
jgi:hypothetical protein